ncbi:large-conductance mechanosensitive channel protein MscL [Lentilactobacillus kosonis]|uniref:Large-conductance mechanosensitive channel n=1 Tax=Lentilactobacillus kosonis TaxID=2810561 RepID=A0A401FK80_9LACO|nr:large-conductance mechanosensitive channel protein MscL [Lentilactobacillus kosonis]GAY72774.1 large-conductance mechanosensitive channel [Lentilactobacillus kosonis]
MFKEFKEFISRGNVVDMAIGVIIGGAFTAIVTSLNDNLINPLIGLFIGRLDLANLQVSIGDATFKYGAFLNSVINFLIIAFVVFLLVKLINKISRPKPEESAAPDPQTELLSEIRDLLKNESTSK